MITIVPITVPDDVCWRTTNPSGLVCFWIGDAPIRDEYSHLWRAANPRSTCVLSINTGQACPHWYDTLINLRSDFVLVKEVQHEGL